MKSDQFPAAAPAPAVAASRLLDDLRSIHFPMTRDLGRGRLVDVCACCSPAGLPELFPCATVRLTRSHVKGIR